MAETIKILVHSDNEVLESVVIDQGDVATLAAQEGVTYEIQDVETEVAPEQLVAKRDGDNLELYPDPEAAEPIAVVEDYYLLPEPPPLVGAAEDGKYYAFVPQTGSADQLLWNLEDGDSSFQSLGYDTQGSFVPWWPILIAGLLVGGGVAALASSSSSSSSDPKPDKPIINDVKNKHDDDGNVTDTVIKGEAEPGNDIEVVDKDGNTVGEGKVDDDGNFEVEVPDGGLEDGEDYEVISKDEDGNESDPEIVTGDTEPPKPPVIDEMTNNFDDDGDPESSTVKGEAEPGSTVKITDPDTGDVVGETVADEDGNFEITTDEPLEDGKDYDVTATDDYDNESDPSTVTGDTTAPSIEDIEITQVDTSDPANDEADQTVIRFETDDPNPEDVEYVFTDESGTVLEPEDLNQQPDGTVFVGFDPALPADEEITITATDPAGNSNQESDTVPDFIGEYADKTAPDAPTIEDVINSDDDDTTTVSGYVEDGDGGREKNATVTVLDEDGNPLLDDDGNEITTTTNENGEFEVEMPTDDGDYQLIATDVAGNDSDPTGFKISTIPPDKPDIDEVINNFDDDGDPESTTIKGETEPGATVEVIHPDTDEVIGEAVADDDGNFEVTTDEVLEDDKEYDVTATDQSNNTSEPETVEGDLSIGEIKDILIGGRDDGWITEDEIDDDGMVEVTINFDKENVESGDLLIVNGEEHVVDNDDIDNEEITIELEAPAEDETLEVDAQFKDSYGNKSDTVSAEATTDTIGPEITETTEETNGDVSGKTEPGATITDEAGNVLEDGNGEAIEADSDGNFTIPKDELPGSNEIRAKDEAGNLGNPVDIDNLPAITEALDFVDGYGDTLDDDDAESIKANDATNDNKPWFRIPESQEDDVNENVLIIDGELVAADKHERGDKVYLQPTDELADEEYTVAYTTDSTVGAGDSLDNIDIADRSSDFPLTVDTEAPEVTEVKHESATEVSVTVDEDADVIIEDKDGNEIGSGSVKEGEDTIIELDDGESLFDGQDINVIATDKAGNIGEKGYDVSLATTKAVDNDEELVLDVVPTDREAEEGETTKGEKVVSVGIVAAGLGGVADAGVLDFEADTIPIEVEEGTARKLDIFTDGGGVSIGDTYDLIIFKEDAYGNYKYYDVYDSWFTVPFLGFREDKSLTIEDPGSYHIALAPKAGVKAIGGAGLEITGDTVIDSNEYDSVSGKQTGNVMKDNNILGDETGQDVYDADHTTVTSIEFDGESFDIPGSGFTEVETDYGTLRIESDGEYTYSITEGARPEFGTEESFKYTITNSETGQSDSANLNINLVQSPSNLVPSEKETLWLKPEAEQIDIPEGDELSSKTWGDVANVGIGIADVGAVVIDNGMEISVGENQVRDVSFSASGGAPIAIGYEAIDLIIYKKEVTENGEFWQEYSVEEDWFGIVGAVIGVGVSEEDKTFRFDEGEYKAALVTRNAGISVAPTATLRVESDELYEYNETVTELDAAIEFDDGYELYSVGNNKIGDSDSIQKVGEYGTLDIDKNGEYIYKLDEPFDSKNIGERDSFSYSVIDSDGNVQTSTLHIDINYVEANDDVGSSQYGVDNIEEYDGWNDSGTKAGASNSTYSSEEFEVSENEVYDLTLNYDLNPFVRADEFTIRIIDENDEVVFEYNPDRTGEEGSLNWSFGEQGSGADGTFDPGTYRVELEIDPRLANTVSYDLDMQGTITTLDKFTAEEANDEIQEGNLLDNDDFKELSGDAEFAHIEVNGKPLDIVQDGEFDNNTQKTIEVEGEHGVLTVNEDGSYEYQANGDSYGVDEFDYKLISITGSEDSATLTFNAGMNISGSKYDDIISGSDGSDTLFYELLDENDALGGNGTDTWTDFQVGDVDVLDDAADQIDISALLDGEDVDENNIDDYLSLEYDADSETVTLKLDRDGQDDTYSSEDLLVLENQADPIDLDDLLDNGQIVY